MLTIKHLFRRLGNTARWTFLIILSSLFIGCATPPYKAYDDVSLTSDKVATIKAMGNRGIDVIFGFTAIDGKSIVSLLTKAIPLKKPPQEISVLPGKHTLEIYYAKGQYQPITVDRWIVAEAGKTYWVQYNFDYTKVAIWIQDSEGKLVGGVVGSDDEPKDETAAAAK
jgi:hypothetical protein